jgi:hypothetical protein
MPFPTKSLAALKDSVLVDRPQPKRNPRNAGTPSNTASKQLTYNSGQAARSAPAAKPDTC